ncbi:hypothetical protein ON05_036555 (plasmid) [Acaryochloris sp. CCMEE 5410]|nr:hypothetical protein ON05_036555 [Acaryochloris sp. CCMEE 5410]
MIRDNHQPQPQAQPPDHPRPTQARPPSPNWLVGQHFLRKHRKAPDHPSKSQGMGSWEEYVGVLGDLTGQPNLSLLLRQNPQKFPRLVNREPPEYRQSWRGDSGI